MKIYSSVNELILEPFLLSPPEFCTQLQIFSANKVRSSNGTDAISFLNLHLKTLKILRQDCGVMMTNGKKKYCSSWN